MIPIKHKYVLAKTHRPDRRYLTQSNPQKQRVEGRLSGAEGRENGDVQQVESCRYARKVLDSCGTTKCLQLKIVSYTLKSLLTEQVTC